MLCSLKPIFALSVVLVVVGVAVAAAEVVLPSGPWWRTTSIYQIYPRSFQDSDGDGIGDIPGIIRSVQGVPCPRGLGFVDLDLGCSTTLLGQ